MKYLKKSSKVLLVIIFILALIFGRIFYPLFALTLIYILFYSVSIPKVQVSKKTDISSYTLTLNTSFKLFYEVNAVSPIPIRLTYEIIFPYYIVPKSYEKKEVLWGRNISNKGFIECKGNRRGTYSVGSIEFRISDPLGFFNRTEIFDDSETVFVFPNIISLEKVKIMLTDPFEGLKAKYRINFDYSYVAGVRDYTYQDPVSMIHWKQTAHRGKLTVKEFDFSASKKILVSLNFYKKSLRFQDYATSIAASIIYYANKYHLPHSVIINSKPLIMNEPKSSEYHMFESFKLLSTTVDETFITNEFIDKIYEHADFGSELFYIDKEIDFDELLKIVKIKKKFTKVNLIFLVDETFVKPEEKPPNYYFIEPTFVKDIEKIEEVLKKENIYFYPIFGNDYLTILEQ